MGIEGYLLLRRDPEGGSHADNETILYETKVFVPFAWSILFCEQDLRRIGEDLVLAARPADASALARKRMVVLEPLISARLRTILEQFVSSIEAGGDGWLVLDPHRIEASEDELVDPVRWFAQPDLDAAEAVFGEDDGVELDDDERLDVGDLERVAGWTVDGADAPWLAEAEHVGDED